MITNQSKLEAQDVLWIWELTATLSDQQLADKFDVHRSTIACIFRTRSSWSDVKPDADIKQAAMAARSRRARK